MEYVLLSPEEVATLLNLSDEEIVGLIETGELGGLKVAGHWRVPLKSITQLLTNGVRSQSARALEHLFEDHATWWRVLGAHPEVTQQIEAGEFPLGSVGAYLKEAVAIARGQRAGQVGPQNAEPSSQDSDYESPGSERRA